jgi:hypothetical protein
LSYEFITTKDDATYLYFDPSRITDNYKIKDIRSGHTGARLGAGLKSGHSYTQLQGLFYSSTKKFKGYKSINKIFYKLTFLFKKLISFYNLLK